MAKDPVLGIWWGREDPTDDMVWSICYNTTIGPLGEHNTETVATVRRLGVYAFQVVHKGEVVKDIDGTDRVFTEYNQARAYIFGLLDGSEPAYSLERRAAQMLDAAGGPDHLPDEVVSDPWGDW